jgi:hypothetical protein
MSADELGGGGPEKMLNKSLLAVWDRQREVGVEGAERLGSAQSAGASIARRTTVISSPALRT